MGGTKKNAAWLAVLLGAAAPRPAQAADFPVRIACPAWSAEAVGQVEARIRVSLEAQGLGASSIEVSCAADQTLSVRVVEPQRELSRSVARRSEHVEDDVVWAVEAALVELGQPRRTPPPAAAPPPPAPPPAPSAAPPAAVAPPRPAPVNELSLAPLVEYWGDAWALGGEAAMSQGSPALQYGLAVGGRVASGEPGPFALSELSCSVRLALSLPRVAGLRLQLGVGPSLLVTAPNHEAVAESATTLAAGVIELQVARPFWFGKVGLSPGIGVRAFTARRNVRVDGSDVFALPVLAPQASLALLYRP